MTTDTWRGQVLWVPLVLGCLASAAPAAPPAGLTDAVRRAAGPDAVVYAVDGANRPIVDIDGRRGFVPASTIKLFTALLALEHLGQDYRFRTEFLVDGDELVVRGGGDPFLVSEEIEAIAARLAPALRGRRLAGIVVDDSFFAPNIEIPGIEPSWRSYDALNAATAVNFNTISVARRAGRIVSGEAQTPLTPHALNLARGLRFEHSLRFRAGGEAADVARYTGELFAAKLREAGIHLGESVRSGMASADAREVYVHAGSRRLVEIAREMMIGSNNFIANQIFLTLGAEVYGPPASLEKSAQLARAFIEARPDLDGLTVVEGSGLAYENRATGPAMAALLAHFAPHRGLLREERGSRHKTGTLREVASLAGYLESDRRGTVRYVVALPGGRHEQRWAIVSTLGRHLE